MEIEKIIEEFDNVIRIHKKILSFSKRNRPELYFISKIIFAELYDQVSV